MKRSRFKEGSTWAGIAVLLVCLSEYLKTFEVVASKYAAYSDHAFLFAIIASVLAIIFR